MEQLLVTEQEKVFILRRRELSDKRKKLQNVAPKHPVRQVQEAPKKQVPQGWDSHCNPCKVHKGRITETHPLFWFEDEIFKNIDNLQHKEQHKKITEILKIPVQNVFHDRQYHALTHLDALWEQEMLPLKYKVRYEEYKTLHGIGSDNVHPAHKEAKPDYKYPVPVIKRPWDVEKYGTPDKSEQFIAGKKYIYNYDKEIG